MPATQILAHADQSLVKHLVGVAHWARPFAAYFQTAQPGPISTVPALRQSKGFEVNYFAPTDKTAEGKRDLNQPLLAACVCKIRKLRTARLVEDGVRPNRNPFPKLTEP